ncbi:zinc-dependent metalloprotease [Cellulosimicrobium cellulans]|uniref:zinc-dependent metalloprotease n=1 Tax=Cellulosimicrobium cellulans TaxID=1710 RepID=UPI002096CEF7|nr:zinc-dependent metalloprotease [Cellulosimicrobium cellulans]MCO7273947.1 zinc-dependent metalloprotease [Cellulosimicrobium cellulans]
MTLVEQDGRSGSDPSRGDTSIVDWSAAAQIAGRLARPGPQASRDELADLVEGLRGAAQAAVPHVLDVTRMSPAAGGSTAGPTTALGTVYVVDRARWARANTEIMASLTDGVTDALVGERGRVPQATALVGAAQVGSVLAVLSSRVLGQFDPYSGLGGTAPAAAIGVVPDGGPSPAATGSPGRLVLVAPNVLQVERALDLKPADFRLWVCLHEQTHALQFAAAPWLADHLRTRASALLTELSASSRRLAEARLREKLATVGRAVLHAVRGEEGTFVDGLLTPEEQDRLADVTAVMALLEGHADVAMDAVGPRTVRTVRSIRRKFEARRDGEGRSGFDVVLRRVLGMDAKIAQYRDGAAFVRAVEREVGRDGFNAVWAAPENLPTAREIADARAWVRRVHG